MKFNVSTVLGLLSFLWLTGPIRTSQAQSTPAQTNLTPSPRQAFSATPPTLRGYWNIDVVGDFTLPRTKSITFCGAGRNLHVSQDWQKLFRRGFSAIERSRMTPEEIGLDRRDRISSETKSNKADTWKSRLLPEQRALILYQNYFTEPPFSLPWARDSEFARSTYFQQPSGSATPRQSLGFAMSELAGGCVGFNDCPPSGLINTFGKIYFDIENEGTSFDNRQEHANLYVYKMWTLRKAISPTTEIGGIGPVPHNSYGNSRSSDFANNSPDWLWSTQARQIEHTDTRGRGMPDEIVGKSFGELADFQMPGTYYLSSDLDYSAPHNGDEDRHWLASLLGEQEVNMKLSSKKRIAWQWLFNTQSTSPNEATRAEIPVPPAIAEGMGIFYWFTGAHGSILWDDWNELTPNAPVVPGRENLDNNRHYACYEHYIHGLWRLFKHHGDLFDGQEKYLNEQTECSYDGGKSWYRLNANALKRSGLAFARAIVKGDQILIAATQAYGSVNQRSELMVRYVVDGYWFHTTVSLKGDEIYLGRATMPRGSGVVIPSQTTLPPTGGGGGGEGSALSARVVNYNCSTGNIVFGSTGGNNSPVEYSAVGITGWTTNQAFTLEAGLRFDLKPVTVHVRQNGVEGTPFVFDLRAYCTNPQPSPNTAPSVANAVSSQVAVVNTAYNLHIGNVFTDTQTPTTLVLSAVGLPPGLSLNGNVLSGIPSALGVSTVTLRATDPGGLSNTITFMLTVDSPPTNPGSTAGLNARVVGYNCSTGAIVFGSTGGNNSPVEYSAIGITGWTTNQVFTLEAGLRLDLKPIAIQVRQNGVEGTAFVFDLKAYCSGSTSTPPSTVNTAPSVVNVVEQQSAIVGTAYGLNIGSVFSDAQTPTSLVLSAVGLPAGLSLNGTVISGIPSALGANSVTLRATDPGGLSNTTTFMLLVSNAPPSTGNLLTASVINYNCSTGGIMFGSTGGNNSPVEYSAVGITGWTTNQAITIEAGLRADPKPITIKVRQNGVEGTPVVFDLKSYCATTPQPAVNTAPSVVNTMSSQVTIMGTAYSLNIGSVFSDGQTPAALVVSAVGLPAGLSLNGTVITGIPSVSGVSIITLRATDPGGLSNTTTFVLTVNPQVSTTPPLETTNPPANPATTTGCGSPANTIGQHLQVTGLANINCQSGTFRVITAGGNGSPINYANLVGLNNADPTNCQRVLDNPDLIRAVNNPYSDISAFQIRVTQGGITSNSITFNFKQYCTSGARIAHETQQDLNVLILGNPVLAEWVEVEVQAVHNEPIDFRIVGLQGQPVSIQKVGASGEMVRQRLWLGETSGVFLLQVSTPTRNKTIKLVRH